MNWISVDKELPKEGDEQFLLLEFEGGYYETGWYMSDKGGSYKSFFDVSGEEFAEEPVAWCRIEPPKEEAV